MEEKVKVLILEDCEEDAFLVLYELKKGGYKAESLRVDDESGLAKALNNADWDLVFTDYHLPQYNGIKALLYIKHHRPELPCIMISGKEGEESAVEAMKAGASDYIMKNNLSRLLPAFERELSELKIKREKKKVELELREREKQYALLFESANDAIVILSGNRVVDGNNRMSELFGYSREEFLKLSITDLSPEYQPDGSLSAKKSMELINNTLQGNHQFFEWLHKKSNGDLFYCEISLNPAEISGKKALMALVRDISRRKADEERLQKSEEKYRQLFSQMYSGFAIIEMIRNTEGVVVDSLILEINPGFTNHTGLTQENAVNHSLKSLFPSLKQSLFNDFEKVLKTDITLLSEFFLDDLNKFIDLRSYKLNNNRIAIVFHDVTKRKQAEKNHELASAILDVLNRPIGQSSMIEKILRLFKKNTAFQAVGIRLKENNSFPVNASLGFSKAFINDISLMSCMVMHGGDNGQVDCKCFCGYAINRKSNGKFNFTTSNGSIFINNVSEMLANAKMLGPEFIMHDHCLNEGYNSIALIPLTFEDKIIGLLHIADERQNCFNNENISFYEGIASSIGIAINRVRSREEIEKNEKRLSALLKLTQMHSESVTDLYRNALKYAVMITQSTFGISYLLSENGLFDSIKYSLKNLKDSSSKGFQVDAEKLMGVVMKNKKSLKLNRELELKNVIKMSDDQEQFPKSIIVVPLFNRKELQSVIVLSGKSSEYSETDIKQIGLMMEFVNGMVQQRLLDTSIKESEEKLRNIIENSADAMSIVNEECRIIEWNRACEELFGLKKADVLGKYSCEIDYALTPEKYRTHELLESYRNRAQKMAAEGAGWWAYKLQEMNIATPDGRTLIVQPKVFSIKTTKGYLVCNVTRDVTSSVNLQTELVETKELYQKFLDASNDFAYVKDADGKILMVNQQYAAYLNFASDELIGINEKEVIAPELAAVSQRMDKKVVKSGKMVVYDESFDQRYFEQRKFPVTISGSNIGIGGYIRDITEIVKSREEEEKHLQMLDLLSKTAMDFVKLDLDKDMFDFIAEGLHKITAGSIILIGLFDQQSGIAKIVARKGIDSKMMKQIQKATGQNIFSLPVILSEKYIQSLTTEKLKRLSTGIRNIMPQGISQDYVENLEKIFNIRDVYGIGLVDNNRLFGFVAVLHNNDSEVNSVLLETYINQASVAIQKNTVLKQLRENESRMRELIEQNNDIIFTIDTEEYITSINPIGEKLFTGKFVEKIPVRAILPEETFLRIKEDFIDAFRRNESYTISEVDLRSRNGSLLTLEISLSAYMKNNKIYEVFGIARNITNSKLMQNQVLSMVIEAEEKQKKMFAEELHDGLGSLLSTINIYVGLLQKQNKTREEKEVYLENLRKLVNEAVSNVRFFVNSLAPNVLNDFGLITAVKLFAEKVNGASPGLIKCELPDESIRFHKVIEINLYRIILELINNSVKYSGASSINIKLNDKKENLLLTYKENGSGFDIQKVLNSGVAGMGVRNIYARINALNGKLDFNSKIGYGTSLNAIVNKKLQKVIG